jgi:hypothetical protein
LFEPKIGMGCLQDEQLISPLRPIEHSASSLSFSKLRLAHANACWKVP